VHSLIRPLDTKRIALDRPVSVSLTSAKRILGSPGLDDGQMKQLASRGLVYYSTCQVNQRLMTCRYWVLMVLYCIEESGARKPQAAPHISSAKSQPGRTNRAAFHQPRSKRTDNSDQKIAVPRSGFRLPTKTKSQLFAAPLVAIARRARGNRMRLGIEENQHESETLQRHVSRSNHVGQRVHGEFVNLCKTGRRER
jgi:hypothetical protein